MEHVNSGKNNNSIPVDDYTSGPEIVAKNDQSRTTSSAFLNVISQMNIDSQDVFQEKYQQLWQEASNENKLLSLLLCDIDLFDVYTDHYSEQSTSFMLLVVALALKNVCQTHGCLLGHYHNHEFMVLLKGGNELEAQNIADALRQAVADSKIEHKFSDLSETVTLSVGITSLYPTSIKQMMEKAEKALVSAKEATINDAKGIKAKGKSESEDQVPISEKSGVVAESQMKSLNRAITSTSTEQDASQNNLTHQAKKQIEHVDSYHVEDASAKQLISAKGPKKQRFSGLKALVSKAKDKKDVVQKNNDINTLEMRADENKTDINPLPLTDSAIKKKPAVSNVMIDNDANKNDSLSAPQQKVKESASQNINSVKQKELDRNKEVVAGKRDGGISEVNQHDKSTIVKDKPQSAIEKHIIASKALDKNKETAIVVDKHEDEISKVDESTIVNSKPQSAIEKHIAALKASDRNKEAVAGKREDGISAVNQHDKSSIVNDKPQSAIEKHITASKASDTKKETERVSGKYEDDTGKVDEGDKSSTVKDKPQSAIEKHIAALKASKEAAAGKHDGDIRAVNKDDKSTVAKNKPQSAIEKLIAASKESDTKKETATVVSKCEVDTNVINERDSAIVKGKPQSAIEKLIAASKETDKEAKVDANNPAAHKLEVDSEIINEEFVFQVTTNKSRIATIEKQSTASKNAKLNTKLKPAASLHKKVENRDAIESAPVKDDLHVTDKESEIALTLSSTPKAETSGMTQQTSKGEHLDNVNIDSSGSLEALNTLANITSNLEFDSSIEASSAQQVDDSIDLTEKVELTLELPESQEKIDSSAAVITPNNALTLDLETQSPKDAPVQKEQKQKDIKLDDSVSIDESEAASQLQASLSKQVSEPKSIAPVKGEVETPDVKNIEIDTKYSKDAQLTGVVETIKNRKLVSNLQQDLLALNIGGRAEFDNKFAEVWQNCCEEKDFLSMFISEVDFFSSYTEHYGKAESEKALLAIASAINKAYAKHNVFIFYLGNGSFAGLVKGGNATKALRASEKICSLVAGLSIKHQLSNVSEVLTMSLGLTHLFPSDRNSMKDLKDESNSALDMAILLGRNQVSL
ncbi:diguanylate cyclase domain-containing protein [Psychromonas sp. PT13]|uniref:diguanylate cyclase domain-containing protein n=1 Tax=Psychromonas sp. PT13 TaxID=3439547 RepID=UPI003EBF8BE9